MNRHYNLLTIDFLWILCGVSVGFLGASRDFLGGPRRSEEGLGAAAGARDLHPRRPRQSCDTAMHHRPGAL